MNYRHQLWGINGGIDYSDGSHGNDIYGNPDHDDWSSLQF